MSPSINPFAANPFAASSAAPKQQNSVLPTGGVGGAESQQMFLQLLVAQLKNQDPMQPQDGTQFVAQLAQFSELEQVIAIRQNSDKMLNGASMPYTQGN